MLTFSQIRLLFYASIIASYMIAREKEREREIGRMGYGEKLHVITRKLLGALDVK